MTDKKVHSRYYLILLVALLAAICSFIYYFPILNSGDNLGIQDWDQNFAWTEFNRISLVEYHQFPWWNPFKKGGMPHFANPQVPTISLQTLLAVIFGTIRGIKINIFLHGIIGFTGFYLLARHYKLSFFAAIMSAILFSFSGITSSYLATGMIVFIIHAYTPFIILFLNKGISNLRWSIVSGFLFSIAFYAGMHIPLLLAVFLIIYAFFLSLTSKSLKPIKALAVVVLTAIILTLPKLILSLQLLNIYPRELTDSSGFKPWHVLYFLTSSFQGLTGGTKLFRPGKRSLNKSPSCCHWFYCFG
jgi:hypothetical protein